MVKQVAYILGSWIRCVCILEQYSNVAYYQGNKGKIIKRIILKALSLLKELMAVLPEPVFEEKHKT